MVLEPLRFYLTLFRRKRFALVKASTVWFMGESAKEPYLLRQEDPARLETAPDRPPPEPCLFCGYELTVTAPAVHTYLKEEKGIQVWMTVAATLPYLCYVGTSVMQPKIGEEIHRQAFFQKGKPRRSCMHRQFTDTRLELNLEVQPLQAVPALADRLDELFRESVIRAFTESEGE
jgi:hypothetical protein